MADDAQNRGRNKAMEGEKKETFRHLQMQGYAFGQDPSGLRLSQDQWLFRLCNNLLHPGCSIQDSLDRKRKNHNAPITRGSHLEVVCKINPVQTTKRGGPELS